MKYEYLRKKYPKFIYENFTREISGDDLKIVFDFFITRNFHFRPELKIKNIDKKRLVKMGDGALDNLVFNIGLIEMLSYWKTTCSPVIEVRAGHLDAKQNKWWTNLILRGMGQYFYENRIDWRKNNFLKIVSNGKKLRKFEKKLKNRYLVPFAGGRDSIVTLESLKKKFGTSKISLFTVNPIEKIQKTAKVSQIKKQIIVQRTIDGKLLEMNKEGFLNGHTPFTSLLSFIAVLCAIIFDYKNIAFSNEMSADEGNTRYLGKIINHQWAKSSEFEKMFKDYCKNYLAKNILYFSYIRKFGELEISKMLSNYPRYFPFFSSCNAGMKISAKGTLLSKERWCGQCPKCLFVYLSLYPYLKQRDLNKIFGKDIFANQKLLPLLKQLIGERGLRPFECVGTESESRLAFKLSKEKAKKEKNIPFLLQD